ncbi:MAG: hypothetical protein KF705_00965 [Phycisphaeraceae bacterium]|nr:hypothetical protein [Phycisphaeraceae bacterium]
MRQIDRIVNARLRGREGLFDIALDGAAISDITASNGGRKERADDVEGGVIDASGGIVCPSFVDPHLHLDLAYSHDMVPENRSGTLMEAIGLWSEAKRTITAENVRDRAIRAINQEVFFGTGFIRTHRCCDKRGPSTC